MSDQPAFINSGQERVVDDHYPTIDPRCTMAFLEHIKPKGLVIDNCAPSGSGIIDVLEQEGYRGKCLGDALGDDPIYWDCEWVISNPPYEYPQVDNIVLCQVERIRAGTIYGVAMLLRPYWDFAARDNLFKFNQFYTGQIHMQFRAIWFESKPGEKSPDPIHHFVWQIWTADATGLPWVKWSDGKRHDGNEWEQLGF